MNILICRSRKYRKTRFKSQLRRSNFIFLLEKANSIMRKIQVKIQNSIDVPDSKKLAFPVIIFI